MSIHGHVYHRMPPLRPDNDQVHQYAQLYILDAEQALQQRMRVNGEINPNPNQGCDRHTMFELDQWLRRYNHYALGYRNMIELLDTEEEIARANGVDLQPTSMFIVQSANRDPRRYNMPVGTADVSVVFTSPDGEPPGDIYLQVYPNDRLPRLIHNCDYNRDPMVYPLLFPYGDLGN